MKSSNESNEMKKTMIVAAALFAAVFAFAEDAEIVKVRGKGTGADKTEALKDAYRDAVERAVGLYVDAEQMMKNEELVKDQILTQSNAYIEKYEVVKENTRPNGLVEVQILAEVRKTALTKKISDVMPSKTFRLGGSLQNAHAQISTVEKRNADGAALLANALEGFDPFLASTECFLASGDVAIREKRLPRENKDTVAANWLFRSGINQKRFIEMSASRLQDVLSQISLSAPRIATISVAPGSTIDVASMVSAGMTRAKGDGRLDLNQGSVRAREPSMQVAAQNGEASAIFVLITGGNAFRTAYSCTIYELDKVSAKVVSGWIKTLKISPVFSVSLLDAGSGIVFTGKIRPQGGKRNGGGVNLRFPRERGRRKNHQWFVLAPWLDTGGQNVEFERCSWHEFSIPKDALPEVKDMKIEIAR